MGVQNIVRVIQQYQQKWLKHRQRMNKSSITTQALHFKHTGRKTKDDLGKDGRTSFTVKG